MKPANPDRVSLDAELQLGAGGDLPAPVHDCWNTIGVAGNGSCRELQKYVHCRNCPVYSAAGIQLLDRPLSREYRQQWTEHYAQEKKIATPLRTSLVIFRIASEWLALSTKAFQEIAEKRLVHTLPHRRRNLVLGLVNIRGELLICVSLGRLLGLEAEVGRPRRNVHDRLMVATWNGSRLVFPVDEVHGIHRIQQSDLRDPPATVSRASITHTQGILAWHERTVGVLNPDSVFASLNRSLS